MAKPFLSGAPTLIQPASSGYYGEAEELSRTRGFPILRRAILRNTAFATISLDIERQWLDLGVPPSRMIRMASGVDSNHFQAGIVDPEREASLPPRPRVVFTGRLHPQKNLDVLLEAWPSVVQSTGARLILVGDGEERDRLTAKAENLGVSNHVHFAGRVDDPAESLRAADAFVLPSVAEGMSNSLLEAMSTRAAMSRLGHRRQHRPACARRKPAYSCRPTTRRHGPGPSLESSRIANFAMRLGLAARRKIEAEFSLEVVVSRYQELYRAMIDGSFPAA